MQRISYGSDPQQYGELYRAAASSQAAPLLRPGVAVIVHGGYWRARYGAELGRPLAEDLAAHGVTSWNLEYRRAGNGGGWPETFEDIAAGIDALAALDLDLSAVVLIGHSAGGQLALWAAGRSALPPEAPGAQPEVMPTAVVSQSGVLDLVAARELRLSDDAVLNFLGASPDDPRYHWADPRQRVPVSATVWAVYGEADETVPPHFSTDYVSTALAAGGRAAALAVPGDHYALIDPSTEAWRSCRELVFHELG